MRRWWWRTDVMRATLVAVSLWAAVTPIAGCAFDTVRRLHPPERVLSVPRATPFLKVHLRDGGLAVLDDWTVTTPRGSVSRHSNDRPAGMRSIHDSIEPSQTRLTGRGVLYGAARDEIGRGSLAFAMDSVVLLESNREVARMPPAVLALLVVVGAVVLTLAIVCTIDPKSCFGSCPTFYVDDGRDPLLQAEGFSSSVAPALEATDVDALYRARVQGRDVHVGMRNEAMETHVVRFVRLLAAPRERGERVFATAGGGELWRTRDLRTPITATAAEGNIEPALRDFDGAERFSLADSTDLAARETVELTFADPGGERGIVIAARQTLLTTFLFYQTLAHMGRAAGSWIAEMERRSARGTAQEFPTGRLLGGIDVQVQDARGRWIAAGRAGETGPLATDVQLVRLPAGAAARRVRLTMTRGMWRLDRVALARLSAPVAPLRLDPVAVTRDGSADDEALAALRGPAAPGDADDALVTVRGDRYDIAYRLPRDAGDYELFVESRGYYLEWMRREWEPDENPARAMRMFRDPAGALRTLAPEYKRREASMEALFWGSRYAHP